MKWCEILATIFLTVFFRIGKFTNLLYFMSARLNLLAQQILGNDLTNSSEEKLLALVEQYPYFSPARILLAKKLQEQLAEGEGKPLQKAVLFSHHPLAFHYSLIDDDVLSTFNWETEVPPPTKYDFSSFEENLQSHNLEDEVESGEILSNDDAYNSNTIDAEDEEDLEYEEADEAFLPPLPGELMNSETKRSGEAIADAKLEEEKIPQREELNIETKGFEKVKPFSVPSDQVLTFEPFHTVDYFASQGIKLSKDEVSTDKVGKQMKSFTQWLKTLKRLPATEQEQVMDSNQEQKVTNLAAHSVESANVLTETMAEVWIKQGNFEKAIEVYNKLSLINPYKNAYFAAKVENLKKAL